MGAISSIALPRISVVVPSYNQGRFLTDSLESIFRQEYPALEVIVMDGGSTDESVEIIRSYSNRLKYWQSQKDGGQSAAINAGMRHCTGDLVAWLNSDDFYWQDALWTVARAWQAHPGRGLYIGNGFRFTQATSTYTPFCSRHIALDREMLRWGPDYLLQPSTFMLRRAWEEVGGLKPDLKYVMDWDVFLRISAAHPAVLINDPLGVSREYEETKTSSGRFERAFEIIKMVREHTNQEIAPGSLLFLLETINAVAQGAEPRDLASHVQGSVGVVARYICQRWGNGHGFPFRSDRHDSVYLPLPAPVHLRAPTSRTGSRIEVTTLIPCRGREVHVDATMRSICEQGVPGIRIDSFTYASDQETVDLARKRIKAINQHLKSTHTEVLGWVNPGDLLTEGALQAVCRAFEDDPELDLVYGNALHIDDEGRFTLRNLEPWVNGLWVGQLPNLEGGLPPREGPYTVPQSTVFFRRRLLEKHGLLNESIDPVFAESEFLLRAARSVRTRKIERTQALCRAPQTDATRWWKACYRFLRQGWPNRFSRAYPRICVKYLRNLFQRKQAAAWPRPVLWARGIAAGLSVLTGIGNPETWWIDQGEQTQDPLAQVSGITPSKPATEPGRFHTVVCGPSLPHAPARTESEQREFLILSQLAEISDVDFFAFDRSPRTVSSTRTPAPVDSLQTPENLRDLRPGLVRDGSPKATWWSRLATLLRRYDLPVPGPKNPRAVTRRLRYVRSYSAQVVQELLDTASPDFLFITPQTNPLLLTLNGTGTWLRRVLIVHDLESVRLDRRRQCSWPLRRLGLKWEHERACAFENEYLPLFDGIIASDESLLPQLARHGFGPGRVFIAPASNPQEIPDPTSVRAFRSWLATLAQLPSRAFSVEGTQTQDDREVSAAA